MKISLVSPLDPFSSFGRHAIRIIEGFSKSGIGVVARPTKMSGGLPEFVEKVVRQGENDCPIEIILGHPEIAPTKGKRTIYYSAWESTRLPKRSVEILNMCERVVVPSNYCAVTHSASGVNVPIDVVPLGYDERFHYLPMRSSGPFVFACAGNLWNGARRKGVQAAIDLFREAFQGKDDIRLNVKLFPGNKIETYGDSRISVFDQFMDDTTFHAWMAEAHCFVHFGIGAFESQVLEFMAMGRGVMAMKFGGHADFFCDSVGLEVAHKLYPADRKWTDHGCFAEPDRDSAVRAFRWAEDNFDHMESIGLDACKSVRHLTWENSIRKLIGILEQMVEPVPTIITHQLEDSVAWEKWKRDAYTEPDWRQQCEANGWAHGEFLFPRFQSESNLVRFNPGMCKIDGEVYLFPRVAKFEKGNRIHNRIECWSLDGDLNPMRGHEIDLGAGEHEDARAMPGSNGLILSFVHHAGGAPMVALARLSEDMQRRGKIEIPRFGGNGSRPEKNWVFFKSGGVWRFIYDARSQVVVDASTLVSTESYTDWSKWKFGVPRGGTPPLLIGDKWITFFHSSLPWLRNGGRNRYWWGAYEFENREPFRITRYTVEPLMCGCPNKPDRIIPHALQFPCGALVDGDDFLISAGVNDDLSVWMRIPQKEIQERLKPV